MYVLGIVLPIVKSIFAQKLKLISYVLIMIILLVPHYTISLMWDFNPTHSCNSIIYSLRESLVLGLLPLNFFYIKISQLDYLSTPNFIHSLSSDLTMKSVVGFALLYHKAHRSKTVSVTRKTEHLHLGRMSRRSPNSSTSTYPVGFIFTQKLKLMSCDLIMIILSTLCHTNFPM